MYLPFPLILLFIEFDYNDMDLSSAEEEETGLFSDWFYAVLTQSTFEKSRDLGRSLLKLSIGKKCFHHMKEYLKNGNLTNFEAVQLKRS